MKIHKTSYGGWENNLRITNGNIELIATLDVGPRIIRFGFVDQLNVFKEFKDQLGKSDEREWVARGGHRLWHAPEDEKRTYSPDNEPVEKYSLNKNGFTIVQKTEKATGIQKMVNIKMNLNDTVEIKHSIKNNNLWPIKTSAWALTMMAPGGCAYVPLPPKRPHGTVFLPDFPLVLWPYTNLSDKRLKLSANFIKITQESNKPLKIGLLNKLGLAAYLIDSNLFIKQFQFDPHGNYPDYNSNFESFTNDEMLELESLSPFVTLQPDETISHSERWHLRRISAKNDTEILNNILKNQEIK